MAKTNDIIVELKEQLNQTMKERNAMERAMYGRCEFCKHFPERCYSDIVCRKCDVFDGKRGFDINDGVYWEFGVREHHQHL